MTTTILKENSQSLTVSPLDALAKQSVGALGKVYAGGTVPTTLKELNGDPVGRMLTIRFTGRGLLATGIRLLAGSSAFPWGGKSFAATKKGEGTGINRVNIWGRHKLFPFETRFAPSVIDGADCIALNYDLSENPNFIRHIHDEIREVQPGVYLGPAMWRGAASTKLVLWFALDTNVEARN